MAPARNAKRTAETVPAEEPLHKKFAPALKKNGVTQATFKQLAEVLEHPMAGHLPEECKKMLVAMLPQSICVPSDQREDVQNLAVTMMGEVMASIEEKLKQAVESESAKVQDVEASKATLSETRAATEATLQAAKDQVAAAEAELKTSSEAMLVAKAAATKSEEAQRVFEAGLAKASAEKAEVEGAMAGDFHILKVGEWTGSPNPHIQAIQPLLSKILVDDSLKTAQKSVLTKKPSERGGFDCTVMDQLDKCFQAKIEELANLLESGKAEAEAKAKQTADDVAAKEAAELRQKECSNYLLEAKQKQKEAAAAVTEAKQAESEFEPGLKAATADRDAKQEELQLFQEGPLACYQQLKDRISTKKQKELAAEAKAAEAKAEAEAAALAEKQAAAAEPEATPMATEEPAKVETEA